MWYKGGSGAMMGLGKNGRAKSFQGAWLCARLRAVMGWLCAWVEVGTVGGRYM